MYIFLLIEIFRDERNSVTLRIAVVVSCRYINKRLRQEYNYNSNIWINFVCGQNVILNFWFRLMRGKFVLGSQTAMAIRTSFN